MKKIALFKILAVSGLMVNSVLVNATQLDVSADVSAVCYFSSPNYTLNFGNLDPASTSDALASVDVTYWCTSGMNATLGANMGLNGDATGRSLNRGTEFIPYALTLPAGNVAMNGPANPVTAAIEGKILNADYINKHWGIYTDTVQLTISGE